MNLDLIFSHLIGSSDNGKNVSDPDIKIKDCALFAGKRVQISFTYWEPENNNRVRHIETSGPAHFRLADILMGQDPTRCFFGRLIPNRIADVQLDTPEQQAEILNASLETIQQQFGIVKIEGTAEFRTQNIPAVITRVYDQEVIYSTIAKESADRSESRLPVESPSSVVTSAEKNVDQTVTGAKVVSNGPDHVGIFERRVERLAERMDIIIDKLDQLTQQVALFQLQSRLDRPEKRMPN